MLGSSAHEDQRTTDARSRPWRNLEPSAGWLLACQGRRCVGLTVGRSSCPGLGATDLAFPGVAATDLAGRSCVPRQAEFYAFVDSQPVAWPIFLATDNRPSQDRFLQRYGERMRGLKPISRANAASFHSEPPESHHARLAAQDPSFACDDVHRQTPLSDAVTEIFTCVRAAAFCGSYYSSFSDTIMRLRIARGTASTADKHDLTPPTWHTANTGTQYDASIAIDDPALVRVAEAATGEDAAEALAALQRVRAERAGLATVQ